MSILKTSLENWVGRSLHGTGRHPVQLRQSYLPFGFACDSALAAMLRVRAEERPSLNALDALLATLLLVTRLEELLAI